jgi:NAD(P)-dependent dehydrogenase (short-subunit alcohol dehydrogenase family)
MTQALNGQVAFITGATRGIGRAIAVRLARDDARLALCGRDAEALAAVSEEVRATGAETPFTGTFDLADEEAVLGFYGAARAAVGPPAILINNAGYNPRKAPLLEVTGAELDRILAVNLKAPFLLAREALRDMAERGAGHIVNLLSTVCHTSMETMGAYTASKNGLEGLSGVLLKEARALGVKVSLVYPGGTDTEFRPKARPDYMRPESVAETVHALLTLPADVIIQGITFRPLVETNF